MNNKKKFIIFSVCASLLLSLFANPAFARRLSLHGEANPEFVGKRITKMVVVAPNVVRSFRAQIEKRMISAIDVISNGGVKVERFGNVISEYKAELTGEEIIDMLKAQQVEAVAIVDIQMDGSRRYQYSEEQEKELYVPNGMSAALAYSANHRYRPKFNGKYRSTTVVVYDVKTGGIMWQGDGSVNATRSSRKWHKKSGKVLAKRFAKYMRKARIMTITPEDPDPDDVHEVEENNYSSGS